MKKQYFGLMLVGLFLMGCHAQESTNGQFLASQDIREAEGLIIAAQDTPAKSQFNWKINEKLEGEAELIVYVPSGYNSIFKFSIGPLDISKEPSSDQNTHIYKTTLPLQVDHQSLFFADITRTVTSYEVTIDSTVLHKEKSIIMLRLLMGKNSEDAKAQNFEVGAYKGEEDRLISTERIIKDDGRDRYPDHWRHGDGIPARPWSWNDPRRRPKD